jgi:pimeloyl-ACP methyl ester carboxylesterase
VGVFVVKGETRMEGELISFEAADGVEIEGMLCRATKSKTCLVHVHGMTDSFYGLKIVDNLMHAAFRNEMGFFAFNNRGQGTITTFSSLKEHLTYRRIGTSFENFKDCLMDIDAALKVLRDRGYENFILSGHSTGCQKIAYYHYRRNRKSVKGLILLAPADDYNFQIKLLGKKKHKEAVQIARKLVRAGKGKDLMPYDVEPSYFSAKRFYELYGGVSVEGQLFNYEGRLKAISDIKIPILAMFGSKEEYAAMPPRRMLRILAQKFKNSYSRSVLIRDADHCFCRHEEEVEAAVSRWLRNLVW